jgi:hypothetical protein
MTPFHIRRFGSKTYPDIRYYANSRLTIDVNGVIQNNGAQQYTQTRSTVTLSQIISFSLKKIRNANHSVVNLRTKKAQTTVSLTQPSLAVINVGNLSLCLSEASFYLCNISLSSCIHCLLRHPPLHSHNTPTHQHLRTTFIYTSNSLAPF